VELVNKLGRDAHAMDKYRASKVLAEKAAWNMWQQQKKNWKEGEGWDLATIQPPFVCDTCF
jgi:hypothetical protein